MVDFTYYKMYTELQTELRELAEYMAKLEYLDELGVPQGKLMFSTCRKQYKRRDGSVSAKKYINLYIYNEGTKTYISRKENKDGILQLRLAERTKINIRKKDCEKSARFTCKVLNSCRGKDDEILDFEALLEAERENFTKSSQYKCVMSYFDGEIRGAAGRYADYDYENEKPAYKNDIYFSDYERFRSKNELITAFCMKDSGISYISEPKYPGVSNYSSDFAILTEKGRVYVEIAGMMDEQDYKTRLMQKRKMALASSIPIVIIDMTDYLDESIGRRRTRLRFESLKRILFDIKRGVIKGRGEILRAY